MIWVVRIALFLLPFLLFWAWLHWHKSRMGTHRINGLMLAIVMAIAALIGMGLAISITDSGAPEARYVPAVEVDGKIVPGRFETEPESSRS